MWRTHMFLVSSVVFIFKRTIFEENSLVCCWVFMLMTGVCKCLKRMFSILQIFKECLQGPDIFASQITAWDSASQCYRLSGGRQVSGSRAMKIEEGFAAVQIYQMLVTYDSMDI